IGAWGHVDPVHAAPGPSVGILDEFVRWWDRWLKGLDNGIDQEPMVVAWMQDPVTPAANLEHRPGRWVAETAWPSPTVAPRALWLGDGVLASSCPEEEGSLRIGSVQIVGMDGGAWCADARSADLPLDQRADDARSLSFTSAPLAEPLEILGFPEARLVLSAD